MTPYGFITLEDAYQETIMRMGNLRQPENISESEIVLYINRSIREVMANTLPYKEWAYKSVMWVENNTILPTTYLNFIRVICSESGDAPYEEARYIDPKEWFTITNWQRSQLWNQGSTIRPVFTIYGANIEDANDDTVLMIYMYPNTDNLGIGGPPQGWLYPVTNVKGWMEYYKAPDYIENKNDIIPIPYEYEDLLIDYTMARVYAKIAEPEKLQTVMKKIAKAKESIARLYKEKRAKEKRELESFIEPVAPLVDTPPVEGELPKDLLGGLNAEGIAQPSE